MKTRYLLVLLFFLFGLVTTALAKDPEKCRVLAVMSYEADYPWVKEMKEGIDSVLVESCEVKYFYMDTKRNFAGGEERAKEAHALYQEFRPHGVIAADDDAQAMFVVPYLKDKVATPVMFCGVNASPARYGYPAANVSGILERHHIVESIALARQLDPAIKSIGFMMKQSPVANLVSDQVKLESAGYPVKVHGFLMPRTLAEAVDMAREMRRKVDVLYLETLEGIKDEAGKPLTSRKAMPVVARAFGKSTIGADEYAVRAALLSAVVKTGQEQGATAARMLLQAMAGKPVREIPVVRNHNGKRMINVSVMQELKLTPKPSVLQGVELVKTDGL